MADADLLLQYRKYLTVQRSVHPETVRRYLRYVASWLTFLAMRGKDLYRASEEDALDWWEQQRASYHDNTAKKVLDAVKHFYGWLAATRPNPPQNLFYGYRVRRVWDYVRPYLTEEQVQVIINLPLRPRPADIRSRALFLFLYSTAARISEALAVDLGDLRPDEHRVILRITKTGKARTALLIPAAWEMLELYLRVARPLLLKNCDGNARGSDAHALWIGQNGRRWNRESARLAIIRLCEQAGLPVPVTPHGLRKSIATHVYRRSKDLLAVKELLGHESLRSTERYLGSLHDQELAAAERYHPLNGQHVRLRLAQPAQVIGLA